MERKTLAIGIGVGMLGAAGVGLGAMIKTRRRRMSARHGSDLRQRASATDRSRGAAASFSGDSPGGGRGAGARLGHVGTSTATATVREAVPTEGAGPRESIRGGEPPATESRPRRTSTRMAPGIPVGSGRGIDAALGQPDSDLGGAVAGDTAVSGKEGETGRDERTIRNDDHDRTTM